MNDLSGVDWTPSNPSSLPNGQESKANYYPTLRPTPPISGRCTPSNSLNDGSGPKTLNNTLSGGKTSTPGNDSFANLVSFNASQPGNKSLSLQEQQKLAQEKKLKEEEQRRRQFDGHFGKNTRISLSANVSGNSTPNRGTSPLASPPIQPVNQQRLLAAQAPPIPASKATSAIPALRKNDEDEADILAAFSSSAPVDRSSHMSPATGE